MCSLEITEVSRRRCPMARHTLLITARKWEWDGRLHTQLWATSILRARIQKTWTLVLQKPFWRSRRNTLGMVTGCPGSESVSHPLPEQLGGPSQDPACSGLSLPIFSTVSYYFIFASVVGLCVVHSHCLTFLDPACMCILIVPESQKARLFLCDTGPASHTLNGRGSTSQNLFPVFSCPISQT